MSDSDAVLRVGVVSDTHIPSRARYLPAQLFTGLAGAAMILHAGDLVDLDVVGELSTIAPVQAVWGNMDPPEVRRVLPRTRVVEVHGRHIGLIHGDGPGSRMATPQRALAAFAGQNVDAVVFGHSHQPYLERVGGVLLFNPGSPTDRRFCPQYSYGVLRVSPLGVEGEIFRFDR